MPLHTDYRPEEIDQVYGNETLMKSLKAVLQREDPFRTFLFTGPSGCGKTTIARIIKNELGISDYDYKYFNASNTRGIDTVREILIDMQLSPMEGDYKLYVFDECHQLTPQAQEALLKDTEEPPKHVFFVFCTTEPDKLKATFKRRGFQGQVEKLLRKDILNLMKEILDAEIYYYENEKATPEIDLKLKRMKSLPDDLLSEISDAADGSPGQALKLLDQVVDLDDLEDARKNLHQVFGDEPSILELAQTIADQRIRPETKWKKSQRLLAGMTAEPEAIRKGLLTYLNKVMLGNLASQQIVDQIDFLESHTMYSWNAGLTKAIWYACLVEHKDG
jgi:DNA polymerase-3 subunit gamma/tau